MPVRYFISASWLLSFWQTNIKKFNSIFDKKKWGWPLGAVHSHWNEKLSSGGQHWSAYFPARGDNDHWYWRPLLCNIDGWMLFGSMVLFCHRTSGHISWNSSCNPKQKTQSRIPDDKSAVDRSNSCLLLLRPTIHRYLHLLSCHSR